MAMNTSPVFIFKPVIKTVATTGTANTSRTSIGSTEGTDYEYLFEAETTGNDGLGARVNEIMIKATATVTDTVVRIWHYQLSDTSSYLVVEHEIAAASYGGTDETYSKTISFPSGFFLNPGDKLVLTCQTTDVFNVTAQGGEYSDLV